MKSVWEVAPQHVGDFTMFQVYRLKDIDKPDTEDNRECKDKLYHNRDLAQKEANALNDQVMREYWKGCLK